MFRVPGALEIRDGVTKILLRAAMRTVASGAPRENHMMFLWQLLDPDT